MADEKQVQDAIIRGDWAGVLELATQWSQAPTAGPRAFFARNVVYLLEGEFALAWQMHAQSMQEQQDIDTVREWVDRMRAEYPRESPVHLVAGLFLCPA